MIVGDTKLGPGCLQMVKVMELLLFRKTADRLVTYRKLTRTPKEYWGPKNTALWVPPEGPFHVQTPGSGRVQNPVV